MGVVIADYRHLKRMTDANGMIQFSRLDIPDVSSGYTIDDNARALLVALNMQEEERPEFVRAYIGFMDAARRNDGGWYNLKLGDSFFTTLDSDDSQGRAFLACCAASLCDLQDVRVLAQQMALQSLPVLFNMKSPRAVAYVLLGICLNPGLCDRQRGLLAGTARDFSDYLIYLYDCCKSPGWNWFEESLTYCNGVMPHALFAYYALTHDRKALRVARDTLGFVTDMLFARGYLNIVGNRGWWYKGDQIPCYDQQPVDACSMVLAYLQAFRATGDTQYRTLAEFADAWYRGQNVNQISLYDAVAGGCYDALVPAGVNLNQGAEALLSMLLAQQAMSRTMLYGDADADGAA